MSSENIKLFDHHGFGEVAIEIVAAALQCDVGACGDAGLDGGLDHASERTCPVDHFYFHASAALRGLSLLRQVEAVDDLRWCGEREDRIMRSEPTPEDHRTCLDSAITKLQAIGGSYPSTPMNPAEARCLGAELFLRSRGRARQQSLLWRWLVVPVLKLIDRFRKMRDRLGRGAGGIVRSDDLIPEILVVTDDFVGEPILNREVLCSVFARLDDLVEELHRIESVGGPLHVVIDDGNLNDHCLLACYSDSWHESRASVRALCLAVLHELMLIPYSCRLLWYLSDMVVELGVDPAEAAARCARPHARVVEGNNGPYDAQVLRGDEVVWEGLWQLRKRTGGSKT